MNTETNKTDKRRAEAKRKRALSVGRSRSKTGQIAFWMVIALVVIASFAAGFLVRSNVALMTSLGFSSPDSQTLQSSTSSPKTTYDSLSARISEVEDILSTYSLDEVKFDEGSELLLNDLMDATQDPYAEYFNKERYKKIVAENGDRKTGGVGVLFADYDGRAYAIDVLEASDAQAQGVQQGDFVVAIDGDRSHNWSAPEVVSTLSSSEGNNVLITWMRSVSLDGTTGEEFTTMLECVQANEQNVERYIDDQVGYIRLRQFTSNSSELVSAAVTDLSAQGAQSYVLDITDNPGGFLTQALDIASIFVSSGVLVNIETVEGNSPRNASGETLTTAPLVVLVNEYTSGVAEVLAAALQDNGRATVVGQTTTGKGSVQVTRELSFGGAVRYTAAYYKTPLGHDINDVGIVPNVEVLPADDNADSPKTVSIEIAHSMVTQ